MEEKYACTNMEEYKGYKVVKLAIDDMWQSCPDVKQKRPKFYNNLYNAIKNNGLVNPIIIIPSTIGGAHGVKTRHKASVNDPPEGDHSTPCNIIWGGSNRYSVLKELGYTHVDCILLPKDDFTTGFRVQGLQRTGWEGLNR